MSTNKLAENPEKTAQVSLSVFFEIMQAWHVKKTAQRTLLGNPPESVFYNWANGKFSILSRKSLSPFSINFSNSLSDFISIGFVSKISSI